MIFYLVSGIPINRNRPTNPSPFHLTISDRTVVSSPSILPNHPNVILSCHTGFFFRSFSCRLSQFPLSLSLSLSLRSLTHARNISDLFSTISSTVGAILVVPFTYLFLLIFSSHSALPVSPLFYKICF